MEHVRIETSSYVGIDFEKASLGERILAQIVDVLFLLATVGLVVLITNILNIRFYTFLDYILYGFIPLLYDLVCEVAFQGQSLGKRVTNIKVTALDGGRPGIGGYLLRWLLKMVEVYLCFGAIAEIVYILNGKGQRLGDIVGGTTVIRKEKKVILSDTVFEDVGPDYKVVFPQVSKLGTNHIEIIKEVIADSEKSFNVMNSLFVKIKVLLDVETDMMPHDFLTTLVRDYNFLQTSGR